MTKEATDTTTKLDLGSFSDKELEALVPMIETELAKRRETIKKEALKKMRAITEGVGMTPEETSRRSLEGPGRPRHALGDPGFRSAVERAFRFASLRTSPLKLPSA